MSPLLSDEAIEKLLLRTMGFDPKTVSTAELRKLVDQLPILSDIESRTISLLIQICSTFFEDSTKISEFYDDIIDLLRLGTDPNIVIAKVNDAMDNSRLSQERFHEAFSRMKDNVVVMRWRNTFLSDELRAAEAALKLRHDELDNADRDADALAQDNTIMVERVARLEAFIARLLEEKGRELAQRNAQIDTLTRQCGVEAERCRDISDANEVLRAQLSSCRETESALRARAEQLAERVSELSAAMLVAQARADALEMRASVENAQHIHDNHEVARGVTALEEQLAETRAHIQVLSEERSSLDAERLSLSTQLAAVTVAWQQSAQSLKEQGTSVTSMFRDNKTLKQDLRRVRDQHKAVLAKAAAREAQLQKRIRAAEAARASLEAQVLALEAKVERAETDGREARAREEALSTQVADLETALSRAQADAVATHARAVQAQEELVVVHAAASASDALTREASCKAATAETAAAQARACVEEAALEITRTRQEAELQTQRALVLEAEVHQLSQQRALLAQQLDAATVATVTLEERLEEQRGVVEEMRVLEAQREAEASELRAERDSLVAARALLEASLQEVLADKATCALEKQRLSSALESAVACSELAAKSNMDARAAQDAIHAQLELVLEERAVVAEKQAAEAEERAVVAEKQAAEAEERAVVAEKQAAEAEERAVVAEKQAAEAEERAVVAEKQAAEAEERAVVAEKQAAEAEERAVVAEKQAAEAEERAVVAEKQAAEAEADVIRKQLAVDANMSALDAAERLIQALRAEAAAAASLQRGAEDECGRLRRSVHTSAALQAALTVRLLDARRAETEARAATAAADLRVSAVMRQVAAQASELQLGAELRDVVARQEHELATVQQANDQLRDEVRDATAAATARATDAMALLARAVAAEDAHARCRGELLQAQQAMQNHAARIKELTGHLATLQADLHACEYRPYSRDTHAARSGHAWSHMPSVPSVLATLHEDMSGADMDEPSGLPVPIAPEAAAGAQEISTHLDELCATALDAAEERFFGVQRAAHALQAGLWHAQSDALTASRALASAHNAQVANKSAQAELVAVRAEASHHHHRAQALEAEVERALGQLSAASEQLARIGDAGMLAAAEAQLAERDAILSTLCTLLTPELQEAERQERLTVPAAVEERCRPAVRVLMEQEDVLRSAPHSVPAFTRLPAAVAKALQERDECLRRAEEALVQARAVNAVVPGREEHTALSRAGADTEQMLHEHTLSQALVAREAAVLAREEALAAREAAVSGLEEAVREREAMVCDAAARLSAREAAVCERVSVVTRTAEEELQRVLAQSVAAPSGMRAPCEEGVHGRAAVALEARLEERIAAVELREASLRDRTQTVHEQAIALLAGKAQWAACAAASTRALAAERIAHEAMAHREAAVRSEAASVLHSADLMRAREAAVAEDRAEVERLVREVALREAALQTAALDLQRVRLQAVDTCLTVAVAAPEAPAIGTPVVEASAPEAGSEAECVTGGQVSPNTHTTHTTHTTRVSADHTDALSILLAEARTDDDDQRSLDALPSPVGHAEAALESAHVPHTPPAAASVLVADVAVLSPPQTTQAASAAAAAICGQYVSASSLYEDMRGVVADLECKVTQLRCDLADALHAQAEAQNKVRAREAALRLHEDAQVELEAVVGSLNARVTQLTHERREVSKKLLATKAALASMQARAAALEEARDASVADHKHAASLAAVRVHELQEECSTLGHLLTQRTASLQTLQIAHAALEAQAHDSAAALRELKARCAALEAQVHEARAAAAEHHATHTALEAEVSLIEVMRSAKAQEEAEALQTHSELRAAAARASVEAVEADAEALRVAAMGAAAHLEAVEARANDAASLVAADAAVLRMRAASAEEAALDAEELTIVHALTAARAAECSREEASAGASSSGVLSSAAALSLQQRCEALEREVEDNRLQQSLSLARMEELRERLNHALVALHAAKLAGRAMEQRAVAGEKRAETTEERLETVRAKLALTLDQLAEAVDRAEDAGALTRALELQLAKVHEEHEHAVTTAHQELKRTDAGMREVETQLTETLEALHQTRTHLSAVSMRAEVATAAHETSAALVLELTSSLDERERACMQLAARAAVLQDRVTSLTQTADALRLRVAVLEAHPGVQLSHQQLADLHVRDAQATALERELARMREDVRVHQVESAAAQNELEALRREVAAHQAAATQASDCTGARVPLQLASLTRATADKAWAAAAALHARLSDSARAAVAATGAVLRVCEQWELHRQRAASAHALLRDMQMQAVVQAPLSAGPLTAAQPGLIEEELRSARDEEAALAAALTSAETAVTEQVASLAVLNHGFAVHTAHYEEACACLLRAQEELKLTRVRVVSGICDGTGDGTCKQATAVSTDDDANTVEAALLGCLADAEHTVCLACEQLMQAAAARTATQSALDMAHEHARDVAQKHNLCVRRLALLETQLEQREPCIKPDSLTEQPDALQRLQSCVAERELELELTRADLTTAQQELGTTRAELQMARQLLERAEDRHLSLQGELLGVRGEMLDAKEDATARVRGLHATEAAAEPHAAEATSASAAQGDAVTTHQECTHNLLQAEMAAAAHLQAAATAHEQQASLEAALDKAHAQLHAAQLTIQDAAIKHATLFGDLDVMTLQSAMVETVLQDALECDEGNEAATRMVDASPASARADDADAAASLSMQLKRISVLAHTVTARLCVCRATMREQHAAAQEDMLDVRAELALMRESLSSALADADAECAEERAARLAAEQEHVRLALAAAERVSDETAGRAALAEAQRVHDIAIAEAQQRVLVLQQTLSQATQRERALALQLGAATTHSAAVTAERDSLAIERDMLAGRVADAATVVAALAALVPDGPSACAAAWSGEEERARRPPWELAAHVPAPLSRGTYMSRDTSVCSATTTATQGAVPAANLPEDVQPVGAAEATLQAAIQQQAQTVEAGQTEAVARTAAETALRAALAQACAERDAAVAAHRLLCGQVLLLEKHAHTASSIPKLEDGATDGLRGPLPTEMHAQAVLALKAVTTTLMTVRNRAQGYLSCLRMLYPERCSHRDDALILAEAAPHSHVELSQRSQLRMDTDAAAPQAGGSLCCGGSVPLVQPSASDSVVWGAACSCTACQRAVVLEDALADALMVARECLYQTALARQCMTCSPHACASPTHASDAEDTHGYRVAGASLAQLLHEQELGDLAAVLRELEAAETGTRERLSDTLLEEVAETAAEQENADECGEGSQCSQCTSAPVESVDSAEHAESVSDSSVSSVSPSPSARSLQSHFEFAHEQDALDALLGTGSQTAIAAYSFVGIRVHDDSESAAQSMGALPPHVRHQLHSPPNTDTTDPCAAYGTDAASVERMMDARLAAAARGAPLLLDSHLADLMYDTGTCAICGAEGCAGGCDEDGGQTTPRPETLQPLQRAHFVRAGGAPAPGAVLSAENHEPERWAYLASGERPSPELPPLPEPVWCNRGDSDDSDYSEVESNLCVGSHDHDAVDDTQTLYTSRAGGGPHHWDADQDRAPVLEGHVPHPDHTAEAEGVWVTEPKPQQRAAGAPHAYLGPDPREPIEPIEAYASDAPSALVLVHLPDNQPGHPTHGDVAAVMLQDTPTSPLTTHIREIDACIASPAHTHTPPWRPLALERATQPVCAAALDSLQCPGAAQQDGPNAACSAPRTPRSSVHVCQTEAPNLDSPALGLVEPGIAPGAAASEEALLALRPLALARTPRGRANRPSALPSPRHSHREALVSDTALALNTSPSRDSAPAPESVQPRRVRVPTSTATRGRARSVSAARAPVPVPVPVRSSRCIGQPPPVRPSSVMAASPERRRSASAACRSPTPTPLTTMRAHLAELSTGLLDQVVTVVAHAQPQASSSSSTPRLLVRGRPPPSGDSVASGIQLPVVEPNLSGYLHGIRIASPVHSPSTHQKSSPSRATNDNNTNMSSPRRKLFR